MKFCFWLLLVFFSVPIFSFCFNFGVNLFYLDWAHFSCADVVNNRGAGFGFGSM